MVPTCWARSGPQQNLLRSELMRAIICSIPDPKGGYLSSPAARIIVVSKNPVLADRRKAVLEAAGFSVISASGESAIADICKKQKPRLVMIGYSVPPATKRRVWNEARKTCKVPI